MNCPKCGKEMIPLPSAGKDVFICDDMESCRFLTGYMKVEKQITVQEYASYVSKEFKNLNNEDRIVALENSIKKNCDLCGGKLLSTGMCSNPECMCHNNNEETSIEFDTQNHLGFNLDCIVNYVRDKSNAQFTERQSEFCLRVKELNYENLAEAKRAILKAYKENKTEIDGDFARYCLKMRSPEYSVGLHQAWVKFLDQSLSIAEANMLIETYGNLGFYMFGTDTGYMQRKFGAYRSDYIQYLEHFNKGVHKQYCPNCLSKLSDQGKCLNGICDWDDILKNGTGNYNGKV